MPCRPTLLAGVALLIAAPVAFDAAYAAKKPPKANAAPAPAAAQSNNSGMTKLEPGDVIDFSADAMSYSDDAQIITANGNVQINRDGNTLTADTVVYNRNSGQVVASGNVVTVDPEGNQAFGDRIELTESLRDGAIDNILLVLNDGGRLAATSATRINGISTLNRAVYSPCSVTGTSGCSHAPLWQIKALRVVHNPAKHRISYKRATLDFLGVPIVYLPDFSHPDGSAGRASGLLLPDIEYRKALGIGIGIPYNIALGPDRDVTIKPWVYTGINPALSVQARRLFKGGPVQIDSFFTYANLSEYAADNTTLVDRGDKFRGYIAAKGQLQHDANWRSTFSVRLTTDDTFNRRYGLDYDDTLRSTYNLERFGAESYLSVSAWAFQDLRVGASGGETPFVLPLIDYRYTPDATILGGRVTVAANTLGLYRTNGQGEARAIASARWDRSVLTSLGQRITATAMVRGDLYDSFNVDKATRPDYAGSGRVEGRIIPVAALDAEWPFAGPLLGGTQTITPRVQLVSSGSGHNNGIPNEDSRAVDLEDTSIFDLNRFPGYDRWEGGSRMTYGATYSFRRPRFEFSTEMAQSARIDDGMDLFPSGTGLSGRLSDFVGRTTAKYGSFVTLTYRYRLDKTSLSVRRNEIDLALGSTATYATIAYLKLNRNINTEDLQDREEVRLGGRVAFAKYWSVFGSTIIDLTSKGEEPTSTSDGFSPIRHRIGVQYEDECFRLGVSWRKDYTQDRDFRRGSSYQLTLAFKNLGF
ncbi:LPS-assembly protein LptD [Glacieibacterium sp.]|uniref:LPS-assembly protein LptD n=1 Tax=Glacieibacterium sp. TaxID=2860237 RepID=UPI003AFF7E6C